MEEYGYLKLVVVDKKGAIRFIQETKVPFDLTHPEEDIKDELKFMAKKLNKEFALEEEK